MNAKAKIILLYAELFFDFLKIRKIIFPLSSIKVSSSIS